MNRFRWSVVCVLGAVGLLAGACNPPVDPPTNVAPLAVATATPLAGTVPLEVTFSATGSSDPDGTLASYSWDFGDGSAPSTQADPVHTYTAAGSYTATLTVTDDDGATATATVDITVAPIANVAPVAAAAATPDSGSAPLEVTFSSAGSADTDGTIESYSWDFGDGSAASTEADPTHSYSDAGTYVATLTVTDDAGATGSATVTIVVAANQAPTAAAAATPLAGTAPLEVVFSSAGSADADGTIESYSWDFGDGSAASTQADPTHTYDVVGEYTATLTVTDDDGLSDTATVTVSVLGNQLPVAAVGASALSGDVPLEVVFSSAGSADADGTIESYSWDFGNGTTSTQANPTYTFTDVGQYTVTLTVTDDAGASDDASVTILVEAPNVAPTAVLGSSVTSGKAPLPVDFSSAGSADSDGTIASYSWDFGDGSPQSGAANPTHLYTSAGEYTATLTVTDDDGAIDSESVTIEVVANQAPTAAADGTPLVGKAPLPVDFSSAGSADSDGTIASYSWDFGDGSPQSGAANPTHLYTSAGEYTATLTVTDDSGASDSATVVVTVNANVAPTAVANAATQSGARPLSVDFSSAASTDPDGSIVSYSWDFGDGSALSTQADPTHVYTGAGTFSATVTVTDDSGASTTSAAVVITTVIDDDGDGVSPPLDCNDADPAINPSAPDALDDAGSDSNCDGYDGVVSAQVFTSSASGSDTATCGAPTAPCATIAHAQSRAGVLGAETVSVAGGSYGAFSVANGIDVRGGHGQNFLRGASATGSTTATVTASANATVGGPVAVFADGLTTATNLSHLTVQGMSAPAGQASYGLVVRNSGAHLTVEDSIINGGTGGAGSTGGGGASANQAAAPGGGTGENAERSSSACSTSRKSGGGGGQTGTPGANGGGGGRGGARDSSCPFSLDSTNGEGGGNAATVIASFGTPGGGGGRCDCGEAGTGGNGQPGRTQHGNGGGAGSAGNGTVNGSGFWAVSGGTGGTGSLGLDGTGGGGGGGGGGNDSGTDAMGAGGGGGGAGGARATAAGSGGTAGAASIAVFVNNSTPTLVDVVVNLGIGGQGGAGGSGGSGQPGGAGGAGGQPNWGGRGGNGGNGGTGGHAGAGGGGAGGPAFGLLTRSGSVAVSGVTYAGGTGGAGGNGGSGAVGGTQGVPGPRSTTATI